MIMNYALFFCQLNSMRILRTVDSFGYVCASSTLKENKPRPLILYRYLQISYPLPNEIQTFARVVLAISPANSVNDGLHKRRDSDHFCAMVKRKIISIL